MRPVSIGPRHGAFGKPPTAFPTAMRSVLVLGSLFLEA